MEFRTTLIYPAIAKKGFNSLLQGMDGGWISHGLASISACAKKAGFPVDLIDLRALENWDHFRQTIKARKSDVVAFTMMSSDGDTVRLASSFIKALHHKSIILAGGPHVSMDREDALNFPHLDFLVAGEGEVIFPQLLNQISQGEHPPERLFEGEKPQMDALPFIDRQIFLDEWQRCGYHVESPEVPFVADLAPPFATIIAGRGCPYNCSFCKPGEDLIFGKKMRTRSPGNIVAELQELTNRYQLASFLFHDDCLLHNRSWIQRFIQLYEEMGLNLSFYLQSRADLLVRNRDLLPELRRIGLRGVFIGFESGSQRILDLLRKGTSVQDNLLAAKICKDHNLAIWANYMLGIPTETKDDIHATVHMIRSIDPDYYSPAYYTPQPGTELANFVEEHDLSLIDGYSDMHRNPDSPKIKGVDYTYLQQALRESMRRKPKNRIRREVAALAGQLKRLKEKIAGSSS